MRRAVQVGITAKDREKSPKKYFSFFEKRLDKQTFVWYTVTVNEAKPPGFHPAIHECAAVNRSLHSKNRVGLCVPGLSLRYDFYF